MSEETVSKETMSQETHSQETTAVETGNDAPRKGDRWFDALAAVALVTLVISTVIYWISSQ